jgi:hypothetical protein
MQNIFKDADIDDDDDDWFKQTHEFKVIEQPPVL